MPSASTIAVFIFGASFESTSGSTSRGLHAHKFANTEQGVEEFGQWLLARLSSDEEPEWVVCVPEGDGGVVYRWLSERVDDLFLQNPTALKRYADLHAVPWNSAHTLHEFNASKVW